MEKVTVAKEVSDKIEKAIQGVRQAETMAAVATRSAIDVIDMAKLALGIAPEYQWNEQEKAFCLIEKK